MAASVIAPAGYFVLRTPLLPFAELLALGEGTGGGADLAADRRLVGARLRALVARPAIREALFLASPILDDSLDRWRAETDGERAQRIDRVVMRYLARMAGRATPFGLFAGCTVGEVGGAASRLELAGQGEYRRHTRLDGAYLEALVEELGAGLADRIELVPNPSLVRAAGGEVRLVASSGEGEGRRHELLAVAETPHLLATLERAAGGTTPGDLAGALTAADPDIAREDAAEFIRELCDRKILLPRLAAPVTGRAPIEQLIADLAGCAPALAAELEEAAAELAAIDGEPLGVAPARYRRLAGCLPVAASLSRVFQVDLAKPARAAVLGGRLLAEVERAVHLLHRLADPPAPDSLLARAKRAMAIRFEDTEVGELPLLELLDEDSGLFAPVDPSPLVDGLPFEPAADEVGGERLRPRDHVLLGLLLAAAASGARAIELTDADLDRLAAKGRLPLPDSLEAFVTVIAASPAALERGDARLLCHAVVGPPGVGLVSRFCDADPALRDRVRAQLRTEEAHRPDAIYAEIVHLPEGRMANVIRRPLLREHEIPYLGTSGAPAAAQLPVGDLTVSLRGDRIVLRSRRLGREVIPRLSCLDVVEARPMNLYRFLVELQVQGVAADLRWRWGALDRLPFLPRVCHGRLILALARWRLGREELAPLAGRDADARHRHLQEIRARLDLPRLVALADGDKLLPIDLDNPIAVDALADLLARRDQAVLTEVVPAAGELAVRGPEGGFVNELVVPFVAPPPPRHQQRAAAAARSATARLDPRIGAPRFGARSGWLFAKIYTGPVGVDRLLASALPALVEQAVESLAVDRWFFVRYGDPGWHLRLRLHGPPLRLATDVLPALELALAPLLADGRILRAALDSYRPEVERYGGPLGLEVAERLFQIDSEAVLAALACLPADDPDLRWRLALAGIDRLLDDLGLAGDQKLALAGRFRSRLGAELGAGPALDRELGARFRRQRLGLEALLAGGDSALAPALAALDRHRPRRRAVAARLARAARTGKLTRSIAELARSHAHMHANRVLRGEHLVHELCIHDFLARLYRGQSARTRIAVREPQRSVVSTTGGSR